MRSENGVGAAYEETMKRDDTVRERVDNQLIELTE